MIIQSLNLFFDTPWHIFHVNQNSVLRCFTCLIAILNVILTHTSTKQTPHCTFIDLIANSLSMGMCRGHLWSSTWMCWILPPGMMHRYAQVLILWSSLDFSQIIDFALHKCWWMRWTDERDGIANSDLVLLLVFSREELLQLKVSLFKMLLYKCLKLSMLPML